MVKVRVPVKAPTKVSKLEKPSRLVELHAKEFSVDLKVQRQLQEPRAEAMAGDFQPHALGLLTASKRADGHTYIVDGQHRMVAARMASYDGLLATRLFENLTLREEAQLFLTLNSSRAVQAIDRFKVRITEGEPVAVGINEILKRYDLHVDWANNSSLNVISAIGALEKIYNGAGVREAGTHADLVDKLISTIVKSYKDGDGKLQRNTFSKVMLEGLGTFIATYNKRIDYDRLVFVLSNTTPGAIVTNTRTLKEAKVKGPSLGMNAAQVILNLYNNRNRAKLPEMHTIEPKNDTYHTDPMVVDPNQYVIEDAIADQEKEKSEAKEKVSA